MVVCQETREMQITRSALPSCPEAMQKPQLNVEDLVLAAKKGCPNSAPLFLCDSQHSSPTSHFGISNKRTGPYPHVFFGGDPWQGYSIKKVLFMNWVKRVSFNEILKCMCFAYEMHLDFARFHPFWLGLIKSQNLHQVSSFTVDLPSQISCSLNEL